MRAHEIMGEDLQLEVDRDDNLFEMSNLPKKDTGITGTIRISTAEAGHAPRVKYYAGRPGKGAPSMSVIIALEPKIIENSLPEHVARQFEGPVLEWVKANHEALRHFWFHGSEMMRDEVDAMITSLQRWPIHPPVISPEPQTSQKSIKRHGRK